jgi:hypothetical protein
VRRAWSTPDERERRRKYRQRYYWRRRAIGGCVSCAEQAEPGKTMCRRHLDQANDGVRDRYRRNPPVVLCIHCGNPVDEMGPSGKRRLLAHRECHEATVLSYALARQVRWRIDPEFRKRHSLAESARQRRRKGGSARRG